MRMFSGIAGVGRKRGLALAAVGLVLPAAAVTAAPLTNGNFEAATNADNSTNTFPGWAESNANGLVAVKATTPLAGLTSAALTGTGGTVGTLSQIVDPISGPFDLSFSFAAVDPGGASASTNNRSLQLLLTAPQANGAQINLIVIRGATAGRGTVQLFGGSFNTPTNLVDAVDFSTSLASPDVNTLRIAGTVGGSYTVTVNGVASTPQTAYQAGNAATPTSFTNLQFTTVNAATVGFVVDNVALTPEPATGLLAAGAVLAATRRRRRQA